MIDWSYIILGAVFTIIGIRYLKGIISEMLFFGIIIAIIFSWHWEFTTFLGFPHLPEQVYKFGAGVLVSWIVYRIWLLLVDQTSKGSLPRKLTKLIFGKVEKLRG